MSDTRRKNDVELAVLASKMDTLSEHVTKHMDNEEADRKEIWREIRNLDKKLIFLGLPLLTLSGGGGLPSILEYLSMF